MARCAAAPAHGNLRNERAKKRCDHRGSEPVAALALPAGAVLNRTWPPPLNAFRRRSPTATPLPARRAGRGLCLLLAGALGLSGQAPLQAQVRLPALGESASDDFNLSQEKRVGEQIMGEIRRDPDYLDDPVLLDYLRSIWSPLVAASRQRGDIGVDTLQLFPYEVFLVRDRSVNAFALPGGYVGVHLGLIALTATPDELASVLAHELSHITQRHIARSVAASSRNSTLGLAAILLGVLAASRASSPDAAQAAIVGGQAAMVQGQLNFSRDMEREADRNGLVVMAGAGFAPQGMASMFDKLDQANRINDSGGYPYLRSHPLTVDRIGEARQRVESTGGSLVAARPPLLHVLMQARARALMDPSVQSLRRLQDLDQRGAQAELPLADRLGAFAGAALASSRLRDFARAERAATALGALVATLPADAEPALRRAVNQLRAELALASGDAAGAQRLLATDDADTTRPGLMLRAQAALASADPQALRGSSELLQTWVSDHRKDASAWLLLSQSADRLGWKLRAVRAEAESQAALGNLPGAIDRLRAGQQLARSGTVGADFIELSVIDARLRDLQSQRRQLLAEQRSASRGRQRDEPTE